MPFGLFWLGYAFELRCVIPGVVNDLGNGI
jgi:hypothetical protein